jgi:hypothetical protein
VSGIRYSDPTLNGTRAEERSRGNILNRNPAANSTIVKIRMAAAKAKTSSRPLNELGPTLGGRVNMSRSKRARCCSPSTTSHTSCAPAADIDVLLELVRSVGRHVSTDAIR